MKNIILFFAFLLPLSLIGQINFNTLPSASSVTPTTPFPTVNTGGNWRKVSADLIRSFIMPRPVTRVSPTNRYVLGYVNGLDSLQYIPGGLMSQLPLGSVTVAAATNSLTLSGLGGLNFNTTLWGSGWVNRLQLSRSGSSTLSLLKGGQTISIGADTLTGASMRWNNIGFRAKADSLFITTESMDSITVGEALVVAAKFSDKAYIKSKSVSGSGGAPSGAAGGDLSGTYPNPTLGTGVVISANVLDGTLVNADLASQTIDSNKVKNRAISPVKLGVSGATDQQVLKYNSGTGTTSYATDNSLGNTDQTIPSGTSRSITLGGGVSSLIQFSNSPSYMEEYKNLQVASGSRYTSTGSAYSNTSTYSFGSTGASSSRFNLSFHSGSTVLSPTQNYTNYYNTLQTAGLRKYSGIVMSIDSAAKNQYAGMYAAFDSLTSSGVRRFHYSGFSRGYLSPTGGVTFRSWDKAWIVQTSFRNGSTAATVFPWIKVDNIDTDTTSNRVGFYGKYVFPNSSPGSGNKMIEWQSGVPVWIATPSGGGGISDGDKGDITVSGSGATWTIDNNAVTSAKIASQTVDSLDVKNRSLTALKISPTGATNGQTLNYNSTSGNVEWATPSGSTPSRVFLENSTATSVDLDAGATVKDRDGTNTTFTFPSNLSGLRVFKNGLLQGETGSLTTRDYSCNTGTNVITFTIALVSTDAVIIEK